MSLLPKHNLARVATSAATTSTETRVYAVQLVGGSASATLKLYNNADGSGTETFGLAALTGTTVFICMDELGPVQFDTAMYSTIAGTGAIAYIWYD